jgi:hypothetical protein
VVTANQTMGVQCHDITAPNLFAVIQEAGGKTNLAEDEDALKTELAMQVLALGKSFSPDSQLGGDLKEASTLAVFEFPKNTKPAEKTSSVAMKGPLFSETGAKVAEQLKIQQEILNQDEQTRLAKVDSQVVKGIYVRRNIPFLMAASISDNFKCDPTAVSCHIEKKGSGEKIEKTEGSYLFRVPNFPRQEYGDQPEYEFVMEGNDKSGNKTSVRVPLYVVNTQASIEGGRNE